MNDVILTIPQAEELARNEVLDNLPLPYLELDRQGFIVRANRAAFELHPNEHGPLIGKMAWDLVAAEEMAPSFAAYCQALEEKDVTENVRYSIYDTTGQFRTYEFYRALILDETGEATGMRLLCVDVTRSQKELAEVHRSALWFKNALHSLPEPVMLTDVIGILLYLNPAAEQLLGWSSEMLAGRQLEQAIPLDPTSPLNRNLPSFKTAIEQPNHVRLTVLNAHGHSLSIEFHSAPIIDPDSGHIAGVVSLIHPLREG